MSSGTRCGDVAVVGAGATGLLLSLLLRAHGHRVTIFERHRHGYLLPRAVGLDHQSMRILDTLGFGRKLFEEGAVQDIVPDICAIENGKNEHLASIPFNRTVSTSGTKDGYAVHQPTLESFLEAECPDQGVEIIRGAEVVGVVDKGDRVELDISPQRSDGQEVESKISRRAEARFVVGCDGANSVVRDTSGIRFEEQAGAQSRWLVVDVIPKAPDLAQGWKDLLVARYYFDPERPRNSVPSPLNRRRWEFMVHPAESAENVSSDAFIWSLLAEFSCTPDTAIIERRTVYTTKGAWAEKLGKGRVALVGDAAHVTPPFFGQGLNGGLRDAKALAWRLDFALKHDQANWDNLLRDYSTEQLGVARTFVLGSLAFEKVFTITSPPEVEARDTMFRETGLGPIPDMEKLGSPGFYLPRNELPLAGRLFLRDEVETGQRKGWLDSLLGPGWMLISAGQANPINLLTKKTRELFSSLLDGRSANFNSSDGWKDLSGRYIDWFEKNAVRAVLVRPDFYIYGWAKSDEEVESIVASALSYLVG